MSIGTVVYVADGVRRTWPKGGLASTPLRVMVNNVEVAYTITSNGEVDVGSVPPQGATIKLVPTLVEVGDSIPDQEISIYALAGALTNLFSQPLNGSLPGTAYGVLTMDYNDTAQISGYAMPLLIVNRVTSPLATGGRTGITGETFVQAAVNPLNPTPYFVGGTFYGIAGAQGGPNAGSRYGIIYGGNTVAHGTPDATNWHTFCSIEVDMLARPGSSVNFRYGVYVADINAQPGGPLGALVDAAISVSAAAGATGFFDGVLFEDASGNISIAAHGNFLKVGNGIPVARAFRSGIDFSLITQAWDIAAFIAPAIASGSGGLWFGANGQGGQINSATVAAGSIVTFLSGGMSITGVVTFNNVRALTKALSGDIAADYLYSNSVNKARVGLIADDAWRVQTSSDGVTFGDALWADTAQVVFAKELRPASPNAIDIGDATNTVRSLYLGTDLKIAGAKVLGARKTGWAVPSGTLDRTTLAAYAGQTVNGSAYTASEVQQIDNNVKKVSQVLAALLNDLHAAGLGSPTHALLAA